MYPVRRFSIQGETGGVEVAAEAGAAVEGRRHTAHFRCVAGQIATPDDADEAAPGFFDIFEIGAAPPESITLFAQRTFGIQSGGGKQQLAGFGKGGG